MAITTYRTTNSASDFTVATNSYATMVDTVGLVQDAPEEEELTFANESTGGEFSIGTAITRLTVGGIARGDAANTAPFLPITSFQNVAFEFVVGGDSSVSGTCSFTRSGVDATAGRTRRFAASARCTGTVTYSWDLGA